MSDIDKLKIRQLDFTLLLVFQGLLRYQRTVTVADELGLSQPAISHAVRRLRDLFGDPLFVRRSHGMAPTNHALTLAPMVESMLDQAHEAVGLAEHFDPLTTTRDFRLASPDLLGPLIVSPLLRGFEHRAPKARFSLMTMVGEEAVRAVRQDQLDLAIGQFAHGSEDIEVTHLYDDEYVVATRGGDSQAGARLTRRAFRDLPFVIYSASGAFRGLTEDELESRGLKRHIVATVPRFSTAVEVVRRSSAAVLAPRRLVEAYAGPFKLKVHSLPVKIRPFRVVLIHRGNADPGRDWLADIVSTSLTTR